MSKVFGLFLLLTIIACSPIKYITKEVPVEVIKEVPIEIIKTEYVSSNTKDSVIIKDSTDRFLKEDTVFVYKLKLVFKTSIKNDTVIVRDTIPVVQLVKVPIPIKEQIVTSIHKMKGYLKVLMWLGVLFLGCVSGVLLFKKLRR